MIILKRIVCAILIVAFAPALALLMFSFLLVGAVMVLAGKADVELKLDAE